MIVADVEVFASFAKARKTDLAPEKELLPLGACGLKVRFHFLDPAWETLSKTAVFRNGSVTMDAVIRDGCAEIPHEVLSKVKDTVCVGVYGTDSSRNLAIPTLWANLGMVGSAANPSGESSSEPTLPYWAQIKEQLDDLQAEKLDQEDLEQALLQAKESGAFDGPPGPRGEKGDAGAKGDDGEAGKDGKSAYEYAKEAGYTDSEGMFGHDLVLAMNGDTLIGTAETAFSDYYRAIQAEKVVLLYHDVYYQVSRCDVNGVEFVGVDGDGKIRHAAVTNKEAWTFDTVEGAVFVGDENTTVGEFYEADRAGKMCFMRRPQAGSGITNWVAFRCSSSNAFFYHVNSTGRLEYGHLASDGKWEYTSVEVGGGGSSAQPDWNASEGEPGYVLNRTHYNDPDGVILAETNATSYTHPSFGRMWLIEKELPLKVGNTYTVIYQGVSYRCECQAAPGGFSDDPEAMALGNFGLAMPDNNTGEPFVMLISKEFGRIDILDATNMGAVRVEIHGEVIHKIDPEYLPDMVGTKLFTVNIFVDENGTATADKTYDEILENARDDSTIVRVKADLSTFAQAAFLPLIFVTLEYAFFGFEMNARGGQKLWATAVINSDDTAEFYIGNT